MRAWLLIALVALPMVSARARPTRSRAPGSALRLELVKPPPGIARLAATTLEAARTDDRLLLFRGRDAGDSIRAAGVVSAVAALAAHAPNLVRRLVDPGRVGPTLILDRGFAVGVGGRFR